MSSPQPEDDYGNVIRYLNIPLMVISTVIFAVRCFVRGFMLKSVGWDDCFAAFAWVFLMSLSSLEIVEVGYGAGQHIEDVPPDKLKGYFAILSTLELLYFIVICFVRLSIIAVLPRICRERKITKLVWGLSVCVILVSLVSFLVLLNECKYIPDLWNKQNPTAQCGGPKYEEYLFWSNAIVGLCIDLVLFAVPIWLVYSRMVFSLAAVRVILVFSIGLFVIITSIIRIAIIFGVDFGSDITLQQVKLSIWVDLELHIGLWVACFPSLPPLIRVMAKKIGMATRSKSSEGAKTTNAWENKSRGYMKSGPETHIRGEHSSIFEDDSSTKKIVTVDEREVGMEMGQILRTTKVVMVDERDERAIKSPVQSCNVYSSTTKH